MRQMKAVIVLLTLALGACAPKGDTSAIDAVTAADNASMNEIMLSVADPNEAVAHFQQASAAKPKDLNLRRALGTSLNRAGRATEASVIWGKITADPAATNDDRLSYAEALIRNGQWAEAEQVLDTIPPTIETFKRYRLEAMIADSNKEWTKADSFYETAVGLTTQPGNVLNNWGYSKLTRGDYTSAERLFGEAITYDPSLFTAKNNIVLARGAQKNYSLPILDVNQTERAQLMHTMALTAIKQGDIEVGKGFLNQAIDTHPQYFEPAVNALRALEG